MEQYNEQLAELLKVNLLLRAEELDVDRACAVLEYHGVQKRLDADLFTYDPA